MRRVELTPLIAAACAGVAAWFSFGSLAVATISTESRFGFLPPLWVLPVVAIGFSIVGWATRLSTRTALPLFFSIVLLLPWIPGRVPSAFLVWTGPAVAMVWVAIAAGMIFATGRRMPSRPHAAGVIAFAVYLAGAWWLSPILPAGDEPHYLVIAQSLLRDGDLRIENNHAEHHYREYVDMEMRPHYLRRGVNGQIYSIHAPGLPVVVAPAFALFGYPGVVVFLALIAAAGSMLLWRTAYRLTRSASAAWFAWAAGALSAPFYFQAFSVFPDGLAATLVLFAARPLFEESAGKKTWIAAGAALGLLPWLHTRFAVIAGTLGAVLLLRLIWSAEGRSRVTPFLSVPVTSAIAWVGFFRIVYGTFDPRAPYGRNTQTSAMNVLNGAPALLFDQQFGLLPNAPVYAFCFAGLFALGRYRRRIAIELAVVSVAYLFAVSAFHMWWGGASAPARFLAPILPLLAVPAAWLWFSTKHLSTRSLGAALLLVSTVTTATLAGVQGGLLAYNVRDGYARAAEWINPLVDISLGMPSFFRHTSSDAVLRAAIWLSSLVCAALALRILERLGGGRAALTLATPASLAIAAMCALTAVWALADDKAVNPEKSQLALLSAFGAAWRPEGVTMQPLEFHRADAVLQKIAVVTPRRPPPAGGTLLLAPAVVPGGRYEVRLREKAPRSGDAMLVIGRVARPSRTWHLASDFDSGAADLDLPVNVGSLIIRGDSRADAAALMLRPVQIWTGESRLTTDIARWVERYGPALVFFFDANCSPEHAGFWVHGGAMTQIAVSLADPDTSLRMFMRNGAAANDIRVEIDGQEQVFNLQPSEERLLPVTIPGNRPGALIRIHSRTGFRPSEVEQGSDDTRFLGVWLEFRPAGRTVAFAQ